MALLQLSMMLVRELAPVDCVNTDARFQSGFRWSFWMVDIVERWSSERLKGGHFGREPLEAVQS